MDFIFAFNRCSLLTIILFAVAARGSDGDDFANNLATDLAPLLALFGEKVTKEFLSQSLGWLDCLILALGPLGIITTIVSAVRVGGPSWMKAAIGRSRENLSVAEMELMSSTSHECCEVWNGSDVIRCHGQARVKELIFLFPPRIDKAAPIIMRFLDEENDDYFQMTKGSRNISQCFRKFGASLRDLPQLMNNHAKSKPADPKAVNFTRSRISIKFSDLLAKCKGALSAWNRSETASKLDEESRPGQPQSSGTELTNLNTSRCSIVCRRNGTESQDSSRNDTAESIEDEPVTKTSSSAPQEALGDGHQGDPNGSEIQSRSSRSEGENEAVREEQIRSDAIVIVHNKGMEAPNIALNHHDSSSKWPSAVVAVVGAVLQGGALLYFGFITYYPTLKFQKDGHRVPGYGFPMTAIGTALLVFGMFLCALVVDRSTVEKIYKKKEATKKGDGKATWCAPRILWLQSEGTVSDQLFKSYALYPREPREQIKTSERRVKKTRYQEDTPNHKTTLFSTRTFNNELFSHTIVATCVCLVGFICQFVGLRAMHWSASIGQLIVVAIMTILRVLLREPFQQHLESSKLERGYELDTLALSLAKLHGALPNSAEHDKPSSVGNPSSSDISSLERLKEDELFRFGPRTIDYWTVEVGRIHTKDTVEVEQLESLDSTELSVENKSTAQGILETRQYLAQLVDWEGPILKEATVLAKAMEETLNEFAPAPKTLNFSWTLRIRLEDGTANNAARAQSITLDMVRVNQQWRAKIDQLEAVLSLWIYSMERKNKERKGKSSLQRNSEQDNAAANTSSQVPDLNRLNPKSDSWVRAKGGLPERGLMLVGPTSEALVESLRWWLPPNGPLLLEAGESKECESAIQPWRVVGNSTGTYNEAGKEFTKPEYWSVVELPLESDDSKSNSSDLNFIHDSFKFDDSEPEELGPMELHSTQGPRSYPKKFLVVDEYVMLPKLYARHLFNAFAWQATRIFQKVPDAKWVHSIPKDPRKWKSLEIQSDQLARLAQRIQESGLESIHEAYISLTPPIDHWSRFSDTGYLIDFTKAVEEHVQELGWKSHDWNEAADLLVELVRMAHGHDEESFFRQRTNGMLVTHLQATMLLSRFCLSSDELPSLDSIKQLKGALERYVRHDLRNCKAFPGHQRWLPDILQDEDIKTGNNASWGPSEGLSKYDWSRVFEELERTLRRLRDTNHTGGEETILIEQIKTIESIRKEKYSVNVTDHLGWTPLHYLAQLGGWQSANMLLELLNQNAKANARDFRGWTSLHYACCNMSSSAIEIIVSQKPNALHAKGFDGMTPTHCIAASEIDEDLYKICLFDQDTAKNGPNHNELVKDAFGRVPLHVAVLAGTTPLGFLGGENEKDNKGRTPLHLAVIPRNNSIRSYFGSKYHSIAEVDRIHIISKLLQRGADINAQDENGKTPLHYAIPGSDSLVSDSDILLLQELLEKGAHVDAQDNMGRTCLWYATESDLALVQKLLDHGARPDLQPEKNFSPLMRAIAFRSAPMVRLLLQHDQSLVKKPSLLGITPLEYCAGNYTPEILDLLITNGASLTEKNVDELTILCRCAYIGSNADFVREIIRRGARDFADALRIARERCNVEIARILEKAIKDRRNSFPSCQTPHRDHDTGAATTRRRASSYPPGSSYVLRS